MDSNIPIRSIEHVKLNLHRGLKIIYTIPENLRPKSKMNGISNRERMISIYVQNDSPRRNCKLMKVLLVK